MWNCPTDLHYLVDGEVIGLNLAGFSLLSFACSPHVCKGFLQVLLFTLIALLETGRSTVICSITQRSQFNSRCKMGHWAENAVNLSDWTLEVFEKCMKKQTKKTLQFHTNVLGPQAILYSFFVLNIQCVCSFCHWKINNFHLPAGFTVKLRKDDLWLLHRTVCTLEEMQSVN